MEAIALAILKSGGVTWLALIGLGYAYWRQGERAAKELKDIWEGRLADKEKSIGESALLRTSLDQLTRNVELLAAEIRGRGK